MKPIGKIVRGIFFDTYGAFASAALIICILSGIVLAIPYDVSAPHNSVIRIMLYNPPAAWFRNLHYWSAQFFLVLFILHLWDQFSLSGEKNVRSGIWISLVIAILFVFFAMLSGFILKGDADSLQARRILNDLFQKIPLAGHTLAYFFLGREPGIQILYMQHIVVATLLLVIITYEHARTLWPRYGTLLVMLLVTGLAALFLNAPLHDPHDPVLKGPWYFNGLQELLHWLKYPGLSILVILLLLVLVWALPYLKEKPNRLVKKLLALTLFIYLLLTITGYYFRGEAWQWRLPWQEHYKQSGQISLTGGLVRSLFTHTGYSYRDTVPASGKEGCISCHNQTTGFSPAHDPSSIGCSSCHLGNAFTTDKKEAHRGMVLIPGNLADAGRTCGTADCHPDIADRIQNTLMSSLSGMLAVDKFVFDETKDPDKVFHINDLQKKKHLTAAETHLKNLCVSCHLGNPRTHPEALTDETRGGGCNACHLNHTKNTLQKWTAYLEGNKTDSLLPRRHPSLSLAITNEHCFGCHSRSGRISTNYEGWMETFLEKEQIPDTGRYRTLQDGRVFTYISEDVHHQAGMDCIDCHTSYELMGDGKKHLHEEDQVTVRCEDCHTSRSYKWIKKKDLDKETGLVAQLRKIKADSFPLGTVSGNPLLNVRKDSEGRMMLQTKRTGKILHLDPPGPVCTRDSVHQDLTCSACHTAWAPSCIGCHNQWDPAVKGFDMLHGNKPVTGTWVEYAGLMSADLPVLGVRTDTTGRQPGGKIVPAIPGMILTIDLHSYDPRADTTPLFHRLFAPTEPHTTVAKGRSCKSCHNDPQTLGFGKGTLTYQVSGNYGQWTFTPAYALRPEDRLPEDAWTGFLRERTGTVSTRTNFRPFTVAEQQRILTVGACLTCHQEDSEIMKESLLHYRQLLDHLSPRCVLPEWERKR